MSLSASPPSLVIIIKCFELHRWDVSSVRWTVPSWRHSSRWECTKSMTNSTENLHTSCCLSHTSCCLWHTSCCLLHTSCCALPSASCTSPSYFHPCCTLAVTCPIHRVSLFDYQAMCKNSHHHASSARPLLNVSLVVMVTHTHTHTMLPTSRWQRLALPAAALCFQPFYGLVAVLRWFFYNTIM